MNQNENQSELKIVKNNKNLIICFGGMALQLGQIPPFEFLRYLSSLYTDQCDLYFFKDIYQCWYHKGLENITTNVDDTVSYINGIIQTGNYEKVIFLGTSAGGYAAILFGSLCQNINNVIAFYPQTILKNPVNINYSNLKNQINSHTKYLLFGDKNMKDRNNLHHILHCNNIAKFKNVTVIKRVHFDLKELRDNGFIKKLIDTIISAHP